MPAANINREFHIDGEPTLTALRENDKALILAIAEIYSNKNLALNCRSLTTTATALNTDVALLCDTAGGAYALTLPTANSGSSRTVAKTKLLIIVHTGGANNVTVTAATGDTVNGTASVNLTPTETFFLYSDGNTKWSFLVQRYLTGTWTPTDGSGAGLALAATAATYTRNGNTVTIDLHVTYPITASGANAQINGLPFTPANVTAMTLWTNGGGNPVVAKTNGAVINLFTFGAAAITNANLTGAIVVISATYLI